jgi:hypothetical protein
VLDLKRPIREADILCPINPAGLGNVPHHKWGPFYNAISIVYAFAVLFGLARQFGSELGTPKPAVFALEAVTRFSIP